MLESNWQSHSETPKLQDIPSDCVKESKESWWESSYRGESTAMWSQSEIIDSTSCSHAQKLWADYTAKLSKKKKVSPLICWEKKFKLFFVSFFQKQPVFVAIWHPSRNSCKSCGKIRKVPWILRGIFLTTIQEIIWFPFDTFRQRKRRTLRSSVKWHLRALFRISATIRRKRRG